MQEVLAIDDTRLNWRHNDQILELVASSDGLLVTQASASLSLQLQRGDRVRTAGRTRSPQSQHCWPHCGLLQATPSPWMSCAMVCRCI